MYQVLHVFYQVDQLLVLAVVVVGQNWDAVVGLVEVGVGGVVDQQNILHLTIL